MRETTVPHPVDLADRIRENRFTVLPGRVPPEQVGELLDVDPPSDFDPIDLQAKWLLMYGIGVL